MISSIVLTPRRGRRRTAERDLVEHDSGERDSGERDFVESESTLAHQAHGVPAPPPCGRRPP